MNIRKVLELLQTGKINIDEAEELLTNKELPVKVPYGDITWYNTTPYNPLAPYFPPIPNYPIMY